jgi:glycosyltransferase involved in cell wall biosynthesis
MRIVLDLQGAQTRSRFRGIGRYSLSLAKAITLNRGRHEVLIALNDMFPETIEPIRAEFDALLPQANIKVWVAPGPVRDFDSANVRRRQIAERLREAFLASLQPDVVHVSSLFEGYGDNAVTSIGVFAAELPTAVTLYDLIPLSARPPDPAFQEHYARKIESFRRATLWLGISEFSCNDAIKQLSLDPNRVINVSCAADPRFRRIELAQSERTDVMRRFGIEKPFICWVGMPEDERKNLVALLCAFSRLGPQLRAGHQLVIIGKTASGRPESLKEYTSKFGIQPGEIVFTGYVGDADLVILYNICAAFVFPSFAEGFGLPALEAMSCGAPVIASNTTSIPEVVGLPSAMFDPHSVDELSANLRHVLTDNEFRTTLVTHHLKRAATFSWDNTAVKAISAFEKLPHSSRSPVKIDPLYRKLIAATAQILKDPPDPPALVATAAAIGQNHPNRDAVKVVYVDVTATSECNGNVRMVMQNILGQLLAAPPAGYRIEPAYAITGKYGYRYPREVPEGGAGKTISHTIGRMIEFQPGDILLAFHSGHHAADHEISYRRMHEVGVEVWFIAFDLLATQPLPEIPPSVLNGLRRSLAILSEHCGVICPCRTLADEYGKWLTKESPRRCRPLPIGWFHVGADFEALSPMTEAGLVGRRRFQQFSDVPTFLMVGDIESYRGYSQVLSAFELLWSRGNDLRLLIVGRPRYTDAQPLKKIRRRSRRDNRLVWLDNPTHEALCEVSSVSWCILTASEAAELDPSPAIAARHKLPLLARDTPMLRELAGDRASFFQAMTVEELAEAITGWIALHTSRHQLKPHKTSQPLWEQPAERLKAIVFEHRWNMVWRPECRSV